MVNKNIHWGSAIIDLYISWLIIIGSIIYISIWGLLLEVVIILLSGVIMYSINGLTAAVHRIADRMEQDEEEDDEPLASDIKETLTFELTKSGAAEHYVDDLRCFYCKGRLDVPGPGSFYCPKCDQTYPCPSCSLD